MFPLTKEAIYIIVAVVIFIIVFIFVFYYFSRKKINTTRFRLVKFGGLFRSVSNLNIGHSEGAPICHARPWLSRNFNLGLEEYLGIVSIPKGKSLYLNFPYIKTPYEVNVINYPIWEHLGDTIYCPSKMSIGYSNRDNIVISPGDKKILIIITWIKGFNHNNVSKNEVDDWLNMCEVYFDLPPQKTIPNKSKLPLIVDDYNKEEVDANSNEIIEEHLQSKSGYSVVEEVTSTITEDCFPPTAGITLSLTYIPSSVDEILFIILPKREDRAIYVEIGGKRTYLEEKNTPICGVFPLQITSLEHIYIEEKILVSPESLILPFYMLVARCNEEE